MLDFVIHGLPYCTPRRKRRQAVSQQQADFGEVGIDRVLALGDGVFGKSPKRLVRAFLEICACDSKTPHVGILPRAVATRWNPARTFSSDKGL